MNKKNREKFEAYLKTKGFKKEHTFEGREYESFYFCYPNSERVRFFLYVPIKGSTLKIEWIEFSKKDILESFISIKIKEKDLSTEPEEIMQVLMQSLVTESDKLHSILQEDIRKIL